MQSLPTLLTAVADFQPMRRKTRPDRQNVDVCRAQAKRLIRVENQLNKSIVTSRFDGEQSMKHRVLKTSESQKPTARIPAITILSAIFALTMAACSTTKTTETKPAETKAPAANTASANVPPATNPAVNSSSPSGDPAGTYAVSGAGPDGKNYQGEVVVTKRDTVHQMSWKIGAESYDGVAVRSGNTLAAAYTTGTDGKGCGAVVYKINADGSLDGKWGEWGVNSSGAEKAVPLGEMKGGVGTFDVSGTNTDGSAYKGKLTVTRGANETYQFAWDTGTKIIGTGVKMGDYLAAGSGAKQCGFVVYEVKGDTLEGKWGVPGSESLGTEKATKK
jgi:hypothetical protein